MKKEIEYKVGDKFKIISTRGTHGFRLGAIVELHCNEKSNYPCFIDNKGLDFYVRWYAVRFIGKSPKKVTRIKKEKPQKVNQFIITSSKDAWGIAQVINDDNIGFSVVFDNQEMMLKYLKELTK